MSDLLDAFLAAHRYGLSPIPLRPENKDPPLVSWRRYQRKRASVSTIRWWLARWPNANPAIATGRVSGVIVLDADGPKAKSTLAAFGGVPVTWTTRTHNGHHYYFRYPPHIKGRIKNFVKKAPGLDLRADGGYAMAPGAIHPDGGVYEWVRGLSPDEVELADVPDWLMALLEVEEMTKATERREDKEGTPGIAGRKGGEGGDAERKSNSKSGTASSRGNRANQAYGEAALRDELKKVSTSAQGTRNDQLNRSAFALGQLVAAEMLDRSQVERDLEEAARMSGLDSDPGCGISGIRATIRSGLQAGMRGPRRVSFRATQAIHAIHATPSDLLGKTRKAVAFTAFAGPSRRRGEEIEVLEHLEQPEEQREHGGAELPIIDTSNKQLRDLTTAALQALVSANDPPQTFVRSFDLVRTLSDVHGRPRIEILRESHICGRLARVANFVRYTRNGELRHVPPPIQVVRDFTALGIWPLPPLEGVVEAPVLRPDGSVLDMPGYDAATRLLYIPAPSLNIPAIPKEPSLQDMQRSLALVEETFGDFPYVDESSHANMLGLLLTPVVRQSFKGHVPLALLDAPRAGTGKGLLADAVCLTTTGRAAALMSAPSGDEEWRKRLTSVLLDGPTVITIDNVENKLSSPSLAAVLTAHNWHDRVLGSTSMVTLPQRATWIATGNNIKLGGDMPRRCYWIRLDSQLARPWQRPTDAFRHPNLLGWIAEHRGELLAALLTIARAWYVAGKPPGEVPPLGSFEAWARTLGGILAYAGVKGFLQNLDALYEQNDEETSEWEAFLLAWSDAFGERSVTVAELCDALLPSGQQRLVPTGPNGESVADACSSALREALPTDLAEGLEIEQKRAGGGAASGFRRRLGKALSKKVDTRYGDLRLERATDDPHLKVSRWRARYMRGLRG